MDNLKHIGARGEQIVCAHLESRGWKVLMSNYRCAAGEIDIIAEDWTGGSQILVFLEVKTRRGGAHGSPIEAVDARKMERLRNIALAFLGERNAGGNEPACRFDIAEVRSGPDGTYTVRLHHGMQSGV